MAIEIIGKIPGLKVYQKNSLLYYPMKRDPYRKISSPPSGVVYRYSKPEHVDSFFEKGELQLNRVQNYRDIADGVRFDEGEGKIEFNLPDDGVYVGKDGIGIKVTNDNPKFVRQTPIKLTTTADGLVLCTSLSTDEDVKKKFGGSGFKINDIPKFTEVVFSEINNIHPIHDLVVDKVKYTKTLVPPSSLFGPRSVVFQKNPSFTWQEEWRFFFSPQKAVHTAVKIFCPDSIKYCSRI